jgi:CRP-like cAMP-binding protein/predicted acylesterase/phospholipase RssA
VSENGRPRRALVLSGGGARGAYEAGVVTALFEREDFDIVCGTSIGAINGALAAQGASGQLRDLWRGVPERAVIRGVTPLEELGAIFKRRGVERRTLRQLLADLVRGIGSLRHAHPRRLLRLTHVLDPAPLVAMLTSVLDYAKLERTLIVGATNITHARPEAFYAFPNKDRAYENDFANAEFASVRLSPENYVSAILASAAIPLAFPKVSVADADGTVCDYVDGGIGNNTPIRQAIDAGADEITVVIADHIALRDRDHTIDDLGSIALVSQDIMQQQVLELDLKLARQVNEAVLRGAAPGKRFVRIRTIGPSVSIALPILGFQDLATIDRAFDQGQIDGRGACDASGLRRLFDIDPTARHLAAGDVLFEAGDVSGEMFVVTAGEVDLNFHGRTIDTLGAGEIVGELALLGSGPRRATAVAKSDCVVVPVDTNRFAYLVQYAPSFALTVLRTLAGRLRAANGATGTNGANGSVTVPEPLEKPAGRHDAALHIAQFHDDPAIESYAAGASIFRPGDPGGGMYVVVRGEVTVSGSDDAVPFVARVGDVFGEMALADSAPRESSAIAKTDARVVPIDSLRFIYLVQNNPHFAIDVMHTVAQRMLTVVDAITD